MERLANNNNIALARAADNEDIAVSMGGCGKEGGRFYQGSEGLGDGGVSLRDRDQGEGGGQ